MATGPQKYPGASTAYFYQNRWGGDLMEVNVCVLHTTEGTTLPDYDGGAMAPNLTAVPDFAAKRLRWFQHFDIDISSRALRNLAGGVETNTLNVVQVELVGTCDPATHAKWTKSGQAHIFWPEAPDWALRAVADFLAWVHANHSVPLTGPSTWLPYPRSGDADSTARMTFTQWEAFKGICGHMHVPENDHGDPGAIDFPRLIALAKGDTPTPPPPKEDPVALTPDEIKAIGRQVVTGANGAKSLDDASVEWAVSSFLGLTLKGVRGLAADVTALKGKVDGLSPTLSEAQLTTLAARVASDPTLAERIAELVAEKLAARLAD
ncbi:hypothetical protein [Streptomyces sp. LUP30]|uniref:hypothetical protein n=1 Tax=Streptomyces sp. LUP30 TaxID=1890285 RepID=UPI000851B655|nr:hypothetical protein [Streptomyces sp. LUP30]